MVDRRGGPGRGLTHDDAAPVGGTRLVDVAAADEIGDGEMTMVQVDGTDIVLVNHDGLVRAMQGICSHQYFEMDKGFLTGDSIGS